MSGNLNYNIMAKTKFKKRMEELAESLEKEGRTPENSKLYNAINDKMKNFNNPINK